MTDTVQLNSPRTTLLDEPKPLSYLGNIAHKKVTKVALTCFESLVHWFLTTFSCFYSGYDKLYKAEVAKLSVLNDKKFTAAKSEDGTSPALSPNRESANIEDTSLRLPTTTANPAPLPNQATAVAEAASLRLPINEQPLNYDMNISSFPTQNLFTNSDAIEPMLSLDAIEPMLSLDAIEPMLSVSVAVPPPVVTPLQKGELHDYTEKKIAGVRIDQNKFFQNEKNYQFLTLNSYKVLLNDPGLFAQNHLDLEDEKNKVIVRDSAMNSGKIEILEYSELLQSERILCIVDPTKIYLRRYNNIKGTLIEEHVYISDLVNTKDPWLANYLILAIEEPS